MAFLGNGSADPRNLRLAFSSVFLSRSQPNLFHKNYVRLVRTREQEGGEPGGAEPEVYAFNFPPLDPSTKLEGQNKISVARDFSEH